MSMKDEIPSRLVIAIGGNATHPEGIRGTPTEQADVAAGARPSAAAADGAQHRAHHHARERPGRWQDPDAPVDRASARRADVARHL